MHIDVRSTRTLAAGLVLIIPLQSGCPSAAPTSDVTGSVSTEKSFVEIEGAVDGLMGYIDFDGQNRAFLFGEKTLSGEVTRFDAMAVATADGRLLQYLFDEDGRMVQMIDDDQTVDITYSADGTTFTLSNEGMTEEYPLPDGFADLLHAIDSGVELFSSDEQDLAAARQSFSFWTFVKAVALPATAMGGFVAASATASPILLGLAGVGALGAVIKGTIDIAQEATNRPLTPTEQTIRDVADSAVLVNDAVSFGVNSNTVARFLTQPANAPAVGEAIRALRDARDGAETLAPVVDQGLTLALELVTANNSEGDQQSDSGTAVCGDGACDSGAGEPADCPADCPAGNDANGEATLSLDGPPELCVGATETYTVNLSGSVDSAYFDFSWDVPDLISEATDYLPAVSVTGGTLDSPRVVELTGLRPGTVTLQLEAVVASEGIDLVESITITIDDSDDCLASTGFCDDGSCADGGTSGSLCIGRDPDCQRCGAEGTCITNCPDGDPDCPSCGFDGWCDPSCATSDFDCYTGPTFKLHAP